MPLVTSALLARPNRAQASGSPRAQHPVPDRPWLPWLAMVAEPPSPTPLTSLQPARAVSLPSPRLGLAVSHVMHVKSRVHIASPCYRSRVVQLVNELKFAYARCVDGTPSTLVYRSSTPRLPPVCIRVARLAIARASRIKSSRAVRARCACCSHASSCASVHVNNSSHLE
jgi:hypothetical protein